MMFRLSLTICLTAVIFAGAYMKDSEGVIIIDKDAVKKASVAVPDFTVGGKIGTTELSKELTEALRFDLNYSGWFTTFKDDNLMKQIASKDTSTGTINLAEWRRTDSELVYKVDMSVSGKDLILNCYGFDLISGNRVYEKGLKGDVNNPRYLVHYLADLIVEKHTGKEGIARTKIAFVANMGTREKHLYIMDYDGKNPRKLSNFRDVKGQMIVVAPAWAPNGRSIFFTSYHHGYPYLYRLDFAQMRLTPVSTFPGLNASVSVSPNGNELAISLSRTGSVEIHKMLVGAKTSTRLTRGSGSVASVPRWSPDGGRIAYVSSELGVPQIFVMNSDGSNKKRLVQGYSQTTSLDWSSRGEIIAFSAVVSRRMQIFVADIRTGRVTQLTSDNANNSHPSFAPNGIHLVYSKEVNFSSDLHMIDIRDGTDVKITNWSGDETYPAWSPVNFTWSF